MAKIDIISGFLGAGKTTLIKKLVADAFQGEKLVIIENEFGRLLSPLEIEIINTWDYPLDVLKLAIQEASTSGNFNIKYIDKIIFNWKKKNIKSVADAKKSIAEFRESKEKKKRGNGLPDTGETGASYYKKL